MAELFLTQWAAVALAQQSNDFFRCVSFLLHGFGLDLIQILSLDLDQFFRRRSISADDRFDSDGDVASTRGVHVRPDGIGPFDKLKEMFDTLAA